MTSCLLSWSNKHFQKGSTLKEKNLLLGAKILSFKSLPQLKMEANMKIPELQPLKHSQMHYTSIGSLLLMFQSVEVCPVEKYSFM